ncbi:hypothetical protein AAG906_038319 [Vitis piasezkii]
MEELALVHDSRFYSMEEHLDQYQTGVTSRFDHFQQQFERIEERMDQQHATFNHLEQRIDRIESCQASQHEEMMAYLCSLWPTGRSVEVVRLREVKIFSLLVAFSSRSRTGRGQVEATVTCHALNAPTASEPVDPSSIG